MPIIDRDTWFIDRFPNISHHIYNARDEPVVRGEGWIGRMLYNRMIYDTKRVVAEYRCRFQGYPPPAAHIRKSAVLHPAWHPGSLYPKEYYYYSMLDRDFEQFQVVSF